MKTKETLQLHEVFAEYFPFWTGPYVEKENDVFKVGDRVLNIYSKTRYYIPFGLRGSVIGHTDDKVLVVFDKPFIGGTNIYGHCPAYRGAIVESKKLINLTFKF